MTRDTTSTAQAVRTRPVIIASRLQQPSRTSFPAVPHRRLPAQRKSIWTLISWAVNVLKLHSISRRRASSRFTAFPPPASPQHSLTSISNNRSSQARPCRPNLGTLLAHVPSAGTTLEGSARTLSGPVPVAAGTLSHREALLLVRLTILAHSTLQSLREVAQARRRPSVALLRQVVLATDTVAVCRRHADSLGWPPVSRNPSKTRVTIHRS